MIKKLKAYLRALVMGIRNYNDLERDFIALYKVSEQRKEELKRKTVLVEGLRARASSPSFVVKAITDNQFKFFDYSELKGDLAKKYYDQAQDILKKDVWLNETSSLHFEFLLKIAKRAKDWEAVEALKNQMTGIELIKERLEEIPNPEQPNSEPKEPYAGL